MSGSSKSHRAFTLIELLIVMAIIALLLSVVYPKYFKAVDRSKEKVLVTNLATVRDVIDKYYADHGYYPDSLSSLVSEGYIRNLPVDPILDSSEAWNLSVSQDANVKGIYDIHSSSGDIGSNQVPYSEW